MGLLKLFGFGSSKQQQTNTSLPPLPHFFNTVPSAVPETIIKEFRNVKEREEWMNSFYQTYTAKLQALGEGKNRFEYLSDQDKQQFNAYIAKLQACEKTLEDIYRVITDNIFRYTRELGKEPPKERDIATIIGYTPVSLITETDLGKYERLILNNKRDLVEIFRTRVYTRRVLKALLGMKDPSRQLDPIKTYNNQEQIALELGGKGAMQFL